MVHSEVCLNKYVVSIAPFSTPDCPLFCMFLLFNFHPFFQGGQLTPFAPMCGRPCTHNRFQDYPGRLVPEQTSTHSHQSWSSDILYQLPPFATIHSILFIQFTCFTVLFDNLSPGPPWSSCTYVEESVRMTNDRDKWRKYVHGGCTIFIL